MKVIDHIKHAAGKTLFTFELLPPLKGETIESIYETADPLMEFNPAFIDVTYHREEIVYKERADGLLERRTIRKRPGTVGISAALKFKYKIDVVPHIICGGFNREETENALIDLYFLGIDNLLLIRGDNPAREKIFSPEPDGHAHTLDLVRQVVAMNRGKYLEEELMNPIPTHFCIGVAGYPEKHEEAPNLTIDLQHLKEKVDAGAEYIVTQMFFDNAKYFAFVDACRQIGIKVPVIPGLKPLSLKSQLTSLPKTFSIDLPEELVTEVLKCKDNQQVRQAGIEWGIQQSRELIKAGAPVLHFFTMGKSDNIRKIVEAVF
ncbi:MAG TPA: methylenetetrahydrofolate reductase [Bacteroidales bacterium]|nr:methylenetetrahydrofolate reductase [Bacteroidales bacterium]HPT03198.1 methylenetetrahydrofolate reductase [Bacteroidales bacterium]